MAERIVFVNEIIRFHKQGGNKMDIAGYRVRFTNWKNGQDEFFFQNKEDAKNFSAKYEAYRYKAVIETIYFQEVVA